MATKLEHVYAIRNIIDRGPASDDTRLSNRLIEHYLKSARALLIKRKLDKQYDISVLNYQTLCVPLELKTYYDCSCIDMDLFPDCKLLRSTCKIPKDIVGRWSTSLQVKTITGSVLSHTPITRNDLAKYSLANKTPKTGWFIENGYLWILNNTKTPLVLLTALWEDPDDLAGYCGCNPTDETPCYDPSNDEFPIDAELVLPMYQMTLEYMGLAQKYPEDNENNTKSVEVAPGNE